MQNKHFLLDWFCTWENCCDRTLRRKRYTSIVSDFTGALSSHGVKILLVSADITVNCLIHGHLNRRYGRSLFSPANLPAIRGCPEMTVSQIMTVDDRGFGLFNKAWWRHFWTAPNKYALMALYFSGHCPPSVTTIVSFDGIEIKKNHDAYISQAFYFGHI